MTSPRNGSAWWKIGDRIPQTAFHLGSVLTSNVVNRATSFVVYAMVARQLGAVPFGYLALATSVMLIAGRFIGLGFQPVMVRRVARDPDDSARLLGASLPAMAVVWAAGFAILEVYVRFGGHSADARSVIRLMYVAALGFAIAQTCEGLLLARDPNRIPRITAPIWIVQTAVAAWIMYGVGLGVVAVAATVVAAHVAVAVLSVAVVLRMDHVRLTFTPPAESWELMIEAKTFLALTMANTAASSTMLIIVASLGTEVEVGMYAAAQQLFTPVALLSEATAMTLYPVLVRRMALDRGSTTFIKVCSEAILAIVIPAAAGLIVLAEPLLSLVYGGDSFTGAAVVMRVLAISVAFRGLSLLLGQVLFAGDDERASLGYAVIRATGVIVLGWLLMSAIGLIGAALATVLTAALHAWLHVRRVTDTVGRVGFVSAAVPSVLAASGMGTVVYLLSDTLNVVALVAVGAVTHAILIGVIYRVTGRWNSYRSGSYDVRNA